jgi:oligoendopeptidase F
MMASIHHEPDFTALPTEGRSVLDWTWEDYSPYFAALASRPLDPDTADQWLREWNRLGELLHEQGSRLHNMSCADTRNTELRTKLEAFQQQLVPPALAADQRLKEHLLASGLTPPGMEIPLRNMRAEAAMFREANLALFAQASELGNRYNQLTGAMTVEWDGEQVTLTRLRPVLQGTDRERRALAYRLISARLAQDFDGLADIWARLIDLRQQMAGNAGCASFREFIWPLKHRFDYTPADCEVYQRSVLATAVPALARRHARIKDKLGVDRLRPWDTQADASGREPLRPFTEAAVLDAKCGAILQQLDAGLGELYAQLRAEQLDLANRPGKAPGGWCSDYPVTRKPFIYMNAVGLHNDVQTLLHEAGHAFHAFASYALPYGQQRESPMEFNEVASMAMELLAAPYLDAERGGFYSAADAARARIDHLDSMLQIWVMVAAGDAFQHWIYANPQEARDARRCCAKYLELWQAYHPAIDMSEIEDQVAQRWLLTLHYFLVPFYYVEYGLAQLGAVQVWSNAETDAGKALAQYKAALALGGTVTLPELFQTAGATFAFDEQTCARCVGVVERLIDQLEAVAGRTG